MVRVSSNNTGLPPAGQEKLLHDEVTVNEYCLSKGQSSQLRKIKDVY